MLIWGPQESAEERDTKLGMQVAVRGDRIQIWEGGTIGGSGDGVWLTCTYQDTHV